MSGFNETHRLILPENPLRRVRLHASCGARAEDGVLLLGAAGAGKSDLLLRLVERGFDVVADDQVEVETGGNGSWASPPELLAGLLEVRGLGILQVAHRSRVRLVLAVALDDAAMVDAAPTSLAGTARLPVPSSHRLLGVPMLRLDATLVSVAIRIEIALDCLAGRHRLAVGALS